MPLLIATEPFLHASLKTEQVLLNEKVHITAKNVETNIGSLSKLHKYQITGLFLPLHVQMIMEAVERCFTSSDSNSFDTIKINCRSEERTLGLNFSGRVVEDEGGVVASDKAAQASLAALAVEEVKTGSVWKTAVNDKGIWQF
ncbi:hypothetical protein HDU76_010546 [Blyttiomyces sp. JEL0837]|nr:hypothetical protein HDU76_010546 [Blyttiomyces sp. JEL0837]